jgi:hypothetical protein
MNAGLSGGDRNNLMMFSHLQYLGSFRPPTGTDESGVGKYSYQPTPFGGAWFDPAGNGGAGTLLIAGRQHAGRIGEFSPVTGANLKNPNVEALNAATEINAPAELTEGKYTQIGSGGGGDYLIGGVMVDGSNMYVNGYIFYDAGGAPGDKQYSCFRRERSFNTSSGTVTDPFRIGNVEFKNATSRWMAGFTAGNFYTINDEIWRTRLGGDTAVGMGGVSILSRASCGPAMLTFNKADLATASQASEVTVNKCLYYGDPSIAGYTSGIEMLTQYGSVLEDRSPQFNGMWTWQGSFHPKGWDSVLFFCRTGVGEFCYGGSVTHPNDQAVNYPAGHKHYCGPKNTYTDEAALSYPYVPREATRQGEAIGASTYIAQHASAVQGRPNATYSEPYTYYVMAYRLSDLWDAKLGNRTPWSIKPYGLWAYNPPKGLPNWYTYGGGGVAYDATNRLLYVFRHRSSLFGTEGTDYNGEWPIVDVYTHPLGANG